MCVCMSTCLQRLSSDQDLSEPNVDLMLACSIGFCFVALKIQSPEVHRSFNQAR